MNKKTMFWLGWTIWICMVVIKIFMVFGDYPDFCWDPMFLMVPFSFILLGGIYQPSVEKEKHTEECNCNCHKRKE